MRVISKKRLKEFYEKHEQAKEPLLAWHRIMERSRYGALVELCQTFPSADLVGSCTVFNIGGNKFRLIAAIHYNTGMVYVREVLTHEEYDQKRWKKNCEK